MSKAIKVRVPVSKAQENVIHTNMRVIDKLKQVGVPVLGATVLQGVATGTLSMWRDAAEDELVYEWSPDQPIRSEPLHDDEDDEL